MAEQGIDAYRVVSVLGYCLLPMVGVGALSVMITLEYVSRILCIISRVLIPRQQRHAGLLALYFVCAMVHMVSLEHFRRCASYV